jgi:hypothetical protein
MFAISEGVNREATFQQAIARERIGFSTTPAKEENLNEDLNA